MVLLFRAIRSITFLHLLSSSEQCHQDLAAAVTPDHIRIWSGREDQHLLLVVLQVCQLRQISTPGLLIPLNVLRWLNHNHEFRILKCLWT
jgi:hypothetical protein